MIYRFDIVGAYKYSAHFFRNFSAVGDSSLFDNFAEERLIVEAQFLELLRKNRIYLYHLRSVHYVSDKCIGKYGLNSRGASSDD